MAFNKEESRPDEWTLIRSVSLAAEETHTHTDNGLMSFKASATSLATSNRILYSVIEKIFYKRPQEV